MYQAGGPAAPSDTCLAGAPAGQQRNARDAVLLGRVVRPLGQNRYSEFSRQAAISKPAASIASRYRSRCIAPPMHAAQSDASQGSRRRVRDFFKTGKPVGVICHGPWTLVEADLVRGGR